MNIYDIFMCPLENVFLKSLRKKLIPEAKGNVLEIGAGTGANFKFLDKSKIEEITIADKKLSETVKRNGDSTFKYVEADVTKLPFGDDSFDTVIETLLLCSVDEMDEALKEIYRVLKQGGKFIHIDHGLPEGKGLKRFFNAAAPIWRHFSKSCRINKTYKPAIEGVGFQTESEYSTGNGVFYGGVSYK